MGYRTGNAYDEQARREWREAFEALPAAERWAQRLQSLAIGGALLFVAASLILVAFGVLQ